MKYVMNYKRIWVTEKLQLASSYMTINEINTILLLECQYQSLLSVCNNCDPMWINFGQMMRQKYVVSNIYVEDTQLQLLWGVKKK